MRIKARREAIPACQQTKPAGALDSGLRRNDGGAAPGSPPGLWIPACAGMTVGRRGWPGFWVPAYAGMTVESDGMTVGGRREWYWGAGLAGPGPGMVDGGWRVDGRYEFRYGVGGLAGWRRGRRRVGRAVGDWGRVGIDNGLAESYYPCGVARAGVAVRRIALYCVGLMGAVAAGFAVGYC